MTCTHRSIFLMIVIVFTAGTSSGQVQTGTPPFGSFSGGPDVINLGNLNAHWTIPVLHKPGRGTNFDRDLTYDSSVWTLAASTWQPTSTTTVPGWQGLLPAGESYIGYSLTYSSGNCGYMGQSTWQQWGYSNFFYFDNFGVKHSFGANVAYISSPGSSGCPPNGSQPSSTVSALAGDGSGYTLYVYSPPCCGGPISAYLVDKNGSTINAPVVTNPPAYWGSTSVTDRNGNQITSSNGTYTDTLATQALAVIGTAPSNTNISYTAPSGATATYVVSYRTYTVRTNFGCSGITEYNGLGQTQTSLVDKVTLPDGSFYQFAYEMTPGDTHSPNHVTGRIASVTLPTGGSITYTYNNGNIIDSAARNGIVCADGSTAGLQRVLADGSGWTGTWNYARALGTAAASTTTITDPQNNQTIIQFQGIYETQRQLYQGSTSVTLLQTISTCYNGAAPPCTGTAISLPITRSTQLVAYPDNTGKVCKHDQFFDSYGLQTEQDDYDYGSGAPATSPLRKILTVYNRSLTNGIVSMPSSITVQDGSGNTKGQTTFAYDETAVVAPTGTSPQHAYITGSRGNATTIKKLVSGSTFLTIMISYYDTGNALTMTDVNNAATTFSYPDATSTCGNAFPTSVGEPLSLSRSMTWNCTGGVQLTSIDENSKTTNTTYANDPYYWRPDSIADPTSAAVSFCYGLLSSSAGTCTRNVSQVESTLNFNSNNSTVDALVTLDGLGRTHIQQKRQSSTATSFDSTEADYDALGRSSRATLPYSGTSGQTSSSAPAITTTYDALGRPLTVTDAGGGTAAYSYSSNDVLVTVGPAPSGENTKRRQLEYDALGRVISVCEITGLSQSGACGQATAQMGFLTKYIYDALSDLIGVTQNAQPGGTAQTRSYGYDGLRRITSETNPESGTTMYSWDSATGTTCGNSSGDLIKRVDANGNWTCYNYDTLHRVTDVGNNIQSASNPCKRFRYDNTNGVLGAKPSGVSVSNTLGRLAEVETDTCAWPITQSSIITDEWLSYTARGEQSDVYESTPHSGGYYHVAQTYWPHGAPSQLSSNITGLPTISYGGTIGSTVGLDGEGRITQVTASGTGQQQNPVMGVSYNVSSLPTQVNLGSGDSDIFAYDPNTFRMTQYQFSVNGQSDTGTLTWNTNSTLQKLVVADGFNGADNQTCNYGYDDVVRLASANCGAAAAQTFTYDPFGNISKSGSPYSFLPTYNSATNRFSSIPGASVSYDANGNVLTDGSHTYAWDVNGNSTLFDGISLTFDALDRMVEQNRSGIYTEIVYSPGGAKLALMSGTGGQTLQKAFIPLPGQATAVYTSSGLDHYRHSDWLGSARLTSSPARTVVSTNAYAPFGETYAPYGTPDLSFTGQNQDTVSDDFDFLYREYSTQGRWTSPDPAGLNAVDPTNPQSWNRYAYVIDDRLDYIDPYALF